MAEFPDIVLTVDGLKYPVSREMVSHRSAFFEVLFRSSEEESELSAAVQTSWDTVKAAAAPQQLEFSLLVNALHTGHADNALYVSDPPDLLLSYYGTRNVSYGHILLTIYELYRQSLDRPGLYVIPAQLVSNEEIIFLAELPEVFPDLVSRSYRLSRLTDGQFARVTEIVERSHVKAFWYQYKELTALFTELAGCKTVLSKNLLGINGC